MIGTLAALAIDLGIFVLSVVVVVAVWVYFEK